MVSLQSFNDVIVILVYDKERTLQLVFCLLILLTHNMAGVRGVLYICTILYSSSFCRPIKEGDMKVLNNDLLPKDRIPGVKLERDGHINRDFHHEAFLGRLVEENKLNPKNLDGSRKLIEIFHKVDLSNNHKVDKEELTAWIHDRILEHYDHALKINKESFKKIDKDDDGLVTLQEYMQGLTTDDKLQEDTLKLGEQSGRKIIALLTMAFMGCCHIIFSKFSFN